MVFVTASPLIRFMSDIAGDNQYEGELFSISRWPFRIRVLIRLTGSDHSVVNVLPFAPWSALLVWRWRWGFFWPEIFTYRLEPKDKGDMWNRRQQSHYCRNQKTIFVLLYDRQKYKTCRFGVVLFLQLFYLRFTFTLTFVLHLWSRL